MSNIEIDLGPVRPLHKGDYSPTATYELNNIVSHGGTSWWMKKEPYVVGSTPTKGSEYWGLLAEGNAQGVIVDGDTIIIEDGNLKVPTATADKLGISKPDNNTIKVKDDGTLIVTGIEFPELPDGGTSTIPPITGDKVQIATVDNVGVSKPDGKTLGITQEGTLSILDGVSGGVVLLLNDYTLPPTAGIGTEVSFEVTADSLLTPKQNIKEFKLSIPELTIEDKVVTASGNSGTVTFSIPSSASPNTEYNVSLYAIDILGNKSNIITKKITAIEIGIATPIITSPTEQEEVSRQSITIQTQAFTPIGIEDTHKDTDWKITSDAEGNTIIAQDLNSSDLLQHTFTTPGVTIGQTYYVWCRYQGNQHGYSKWAKVEVRILTPTIKAPTIVSPTANSRVPKIGFTAIVSGFGVVEDGETDTHKSTDWKLTNKAGNKTYQESLNDTTNKLSFKFNSPDTTDLGEAKLMVRFNGTDLGAGQWLEVPLNIVETYIETPTITAPSADSTVYQNITMVLGGYKVIPDSVTDEHKATTWILSRDEQGDDVIQRSDNNTTDKLSHTFTNIEGLTTEGFNVWCHAIQHSTNGLSSDKVSVKVLLKKGTVTPSGRVLYRHESNEGTVIEYTQSNETKGTTENRKLLILDAKYRGQGYWGGSDMIQPNTRYINQDGFNFLPTVFTNYPNLSDNEIDEKVKVTIISSTGEVTRNSNINDDKLGTGRYNTSIIAKIQGSGKEEPTAAKGCRNIKNIPGFSDGFDLPTTRELIVIYVERENIDSLDPTGSQYPTMKLGQSNPQGD